jgi:XTP/dITP diphosphohydrolase
MSSVRWFPRNTVHAPNRAPRQLFLATGNPGKLEEFRALARSMRGNFAIPEIDILPTFSALPGFPEDAPTFAENAAGKAIHYSRFCDGYVLADDSGLVVPALGGEPGVRSARYAGPNATSEERIAKLLAALETKVGKERDAYFVCVLCLARRGNVLAVVSEAAYGTIARQPAGTRGFGYDPVFCPREGAKSFAELSGEEKNVTSHRGKAFTRLLNDLQEY